MEATLPDFAHPPVVEVFLAVQYEPLTALRTPQIGLLWANYRDRFPTIEEHPPLTPMIERFGVTGPPRGSLRLEPLESLPVPRCWFLNEAGTELLQVQQDRFVHNWRKVGTGDVYPRYEHVRGTFEDELVRLEDFLRHEELGVLDPNLCEVGYVNHIVAGAGWETHGQLGEVLTVFDAAYSEAFLPEAEEAYVAARYVIPGADGQPLGRLHVTVDPVYRREDNRPMLLMTLSARGRPDGDGVDGVLRFLDTGRQWIVRGFAALTTERMHEIWGRCDEH